MLHSAHWTSLLFLSETEMLYQDVFCCFVVFFTHPWRLRRWLKGSNMNLDVITPCSGMWVNWWGLAYSSLGCYLVWGHQSHESFPLSPPDYLDDLSQGHAMLKNPFRMKNRQRVSLNLDPSISLTHREKSLLKYMVAHGSSLPSVLSVWTSVWLLNTSHRPVPARHAEFMIKGWR